MPKCFVSGCDVTISKGVTGHRFPYRNDIARARKWLIACKIDYGTNIKTFEFDGLYICGGHFCEEDYEVDIMTVRLNEGLPEELKRKPRKKLKDTAIPSVNMPHSATASKSERTSSVNRQRREEELIEKQRKHDEITRLCLPISTDPSSEEDQPAPRLAPSTSRLRLPISTDPSSEEGQPAPRLAPSTSRKRRRKRSGHGKKGQTEQSKVLEDKSEITSASSQEDHSSKLGNLPATEQTIYMETTQSTDHNPSSSQEIHWMEQPIVPDNLFETVVDAGHIISDLPAQSGFTDQPLITPVVTSTAQNIHVDPLLQHAQPLQVVSRLNVQQVEFPRPDEFIATTSLDCVCGSTVQHSRTMVTEGTQTDLIIIGDPNVVKKDHHYYVLTPKKPAPVETQKPDHVQPSTKAKPSITKPGTKQPIARPAQPPTRQQPILAKLHQKQPIARPAQPPTRQQPSIAKLHQKQPVASPVQTPTRQQPSIAKPGTKQPVASTAHAQSKPKPYATTPNPMQPNVGPVQRPQTSIAKTDSMPQVSFSIPKLKQPIATSESKPQSITEPSSEQLPRKRRRVSLFMPKKPSDSSDSFSFSDRSSDPDFIVSDDDPLDQSKSPEEVAAEGIASVHDTKYLVFEKQLIQLLGFVRCPTCSSSLDLPAEEAHVGKITGTALEVNLKCTNKKKQHTFKWASQPVIGRGREEMFAGNLLVSASVLFSGGNFAKVSHFANVLKLPLISKATFYRHQADYLCPAVHDAWARHQADIFHDIRVRGTLQVSGDGRCDSPGYSAKFCTYTIMDMETDLIIDTETVEVTEVKNSNAMEQEGCKRILDRCEAELPLDVLCTDRHMGIQKMMRDHYSNINHQYDVWHLAKSISKRLIQKGKKKESADLLPWVPSIKTHLWWAAASCDGDPAVLVEKWQSVRYHATNQHEWHTGKHHTKCSHGDLSEVEKEVKWIEVESPAHKALNKVLDDKRLLDGIKKLNLFCHTGKLENFNGFLTKYAPKRISFEHQGMVARTRLAALDHNSNVGRKQATITKAKSNTGEVGEPRYNVSYSKATGKFSARPVYEDKDYEFLNEIMVDVVTRKCEQRKKDTTAYIAPTTTRPTIAPRDKPRPSKEELIRTHQSRYGEGEGHSSDE